MLPVRYQFRPTVQAAALWLAPGDASARSKAVSSTFNSWYRAATWNAPQWPLPKSKLFRGLTPLAASVAFSPVSTHDPATCQASLATSSLTVPRWTGVLVCTYSAQPPNALLKYHACGEYRF